jgi:small-conductance mechanosensitive channel
LRRAKDPLTAGFLAQFIRFIIIILGFSIALGIIGLNSVASKILAGAGITAFIIGFAFRDIGENLLAGILMAFKRPFRIGDTVETIGISGKITGLNMRETIIKTSDGRDVFVPNGIIIKNPLHNFTIDTFNRQEFFVNILQTLDIAKAIHIISQALDSIPGILKNDLSPIVEANDIAGNTIKLSIRFWTDWQTATNSSSQIKSEAIQKVVKELHEAGYL